MHHDIAALRACEFFDLLERFVRSDHRPAARTFHPYTPLPWSCHSRPN